MTLTSPTSSATHFYNHVKNIFNQTDIYDDAIELRFRGCKFNIHDGILGYVHPTIGWFRVASFDDDRKDSIESIQWVLDEYGNNITFLVLDVDAYNEEIGLEGFVKTEEIFGLLIGCSSYREPVEELRDRGIIKILAVEPRS